LEIIKRMDRTAHIAIIQACVVDRTQRSAVANDDDTEIAKQADHVLYVPRTYGYFGPIVNIIPLQLLSYYVAVARGTNVDQPRNLAKSVTVE